MSNKHTLYLQSPSFRLFTLVISLLVLYVVICEVAMRTDFAHSVFGVPTIGSTDRGFEGRLHALKMFADNRESIDCVFFGDSTAMTDFAPNTFAASFREAADTDIECFNFGAGAFTLADLSALVQIVVRDYSPQVVIVGVEALNFAVPTNLSQGSNFVQLPWTAYQLGHFTFEGWLFENSALYPRLGTLRQLLTLETTPSALVLSAAALNRDWEDGYFPLKGPNAFDVAQPPDPNSDHPYHENYFGSLSDFQLLSEHLSALDRILALNDTSTQVIILEMPVARTFSYYFSRSERDYADFTSAVEQSATDTGVPFWRTTDLGFFEDELWFNYNHLNETGAQIFSQWLGNRLGTAVRNGTIQFREHTVQASPR